jgi:YebC/PmpR family DNA-binding regulatory protein
MGRAFEYRKASKMKRWGNMSKLFPKLAKAITIAAKTNNDPDMNPALRTAIATAKAHNLPKDNIEAAIKRASGKETENLSEVNYEGKWLYGVLIFIETATENTARTVANIKMIFNKNNGTLVPTGSLEFMFNRKSVFEIEKFNGNIEELEMELIDVGLEKITSEVDGSLHIFGDYIDFGNISKALEDMNIEYQKGSLQRISNSPVKITDNQMDELSILLDKIEDDDDVQNVYTNLE